MVQLWKEKRGIGGMALLCEKWWKILVCLTLKEKESIVKKKEKRQMNTLQEFTMRKEKERMGRSELRFEQEWWNWNDQCSS